MLKRLVLVGVIVGSSLMAAQYTKADRMKDMQIMSDAMGEIQTGFFYNDKDRVIKGALKLSDAVRHVRPPIEEMEEKNPMVRYMNAKVKFSNKIVKKIDKKTATLIERFRSGDTNQALQAYKKIMESCMECHAKIRKW